MTQPSRVCELLNARGSSPGACLQATPTLRHKRRPRRQHKSEGPSAAVAPEEEAQHRSEGPQQQHDSRESQRTFRGPAERHNRRPLAQKPRRRGKGSTSRRCPAQAVSQAQFRHTQDRAGLQERPQRLQRGPCLKGVKELAVVKETRSTGSAHTKGSDRCSHARLAVTERRASLGSSTRVKARQRRRQTSRKSAQHKSEGPLQQWYSRECLKTVGGPEKWHARRHQKAISTKTSRLRLKKKAHLKRCTAQAVAQTQVQHP